MKKFTLLLFVLCIGILGTNTAIATPVATTTATAIEAAAPTTMTKAEKKAWKKSQKQLKKQERKANRRAKFAAWVSKIMNSNQIVAIVLAFFLGGLGIHRVYMGSKPIIILWHILTLFGIFGLIPFIDFIRLIIGGTDHYEGDDSLFRCFQ